MSVRNCKRGLVATGTSLLSATLPAQVQWQRFDLPPATSAPVVHDAARDRFVRLSAPNGIGAPETWEWARSGGWLHGLPATAPPWRGGHAMAHDLQQGFTVLFSGYGTLTFVLRETYEWNGLDWVNRSPALQPPVRQGHAMAYDLVRGKVVMFGGRHPDPNGSDYGDTWEWDGSSWLQRAAPGPLPRHGHALAHDSARGVTVLYGGVGAGLPLFGTPLTDTWEWNGTAWTRRLPANDPGPRTEFGMAFDVARRRAHPEASDLTIEELLRAWLRLRPGAEHGDGVGRPVAWPRKSSAGDA
jgi:hypothetical protein